MTAQAVNWLVALAPVLVLLVTFEWLDVFHLVGWREMAAMLGLGALAGLSAWPVSGRLLDTLPIGFSAYSRYAAPFIEEALKGAAIAWLFARNRVGFALDAVIAGFAVGAGFSVVENVLYLARYGQLDIGIWVVRGLGTAIMHGATGATFAGLAQRLGERQAKAPIARWPPHPLHYLPGYAVAVGIHLLFNHFPDRPQLAMLTTLTAAPLLVMVAFRYGAIEAEQWLDAEQSGHRAALAALEAGGWPETAAGRHVAGLADRIGGRATGESVQALYAALTAMALRAEGTLRAGGGAIEAADAALVTRRRALERALGRTTVATMRPLLPFSRHEWWEIAAFEARVHHAHGRRAHG